MRHGVKVIKVAKHKIEYKGSAKIIVEGKDMQRFINLLRPLMDPTQSLPNLLIYPGPQPTWGTVHKKLKRLGDKYDTHLWNPIPNPAPGDHKITTSRTQKMTRFMLLRRR